MDKLIITAACDSSVSYPSNKNCPAPTRENTSVIAEEYIRCIDTGAAIAHLHGVRKLEPALQADGRKLSRIDVEGWAEITEGIRSQREAIIQFGVAGARFEDRVPLLEIAPGLRVPGLGPVQRLAAAFNQQTTGHVNSTWATPVTSQSKAP